jgi:hypothetical protein
VLRASFLVCGSSLWVLLLSSQGFAQPTEVDEPANTGVQEGIPLRQPPPASAPAEEPAEKQAPETQPKTAREASAASQREGAETTRQETAEADGDEEEEESPQFAYFGIGPTVLGISSYDEYGVALAVGGRFPFHERMAVNAGLTWGLTSFWRTERWWEEARQIGSWTTRAYGNVTRWAGEGEDDDALRYMAAFYAYIGLLFPYLISGIMYVAGPLAATSYIDFHMEASFHLFETRKGPYVAAGLGTLAFVDPIYGDLKGGVGPSFGAGFDFGWFGVEARGFVSPRYLHGEATAQRTDVFTGTFLLRVQGK